VLWKESTLPVLHRVVVNGEEIAVQGEIDGFRDALVDAVKSGGALVPLEVGPHRQVEVLVTGATSVLIETMDVPEETHDAGEASVDLDIDWWGPPQ
jgi:hypothetical protein